MKVYKYFRLLNSGGQGTLWLAWDIFAKREVAIKVFDAPLPEASEQEVFDKYNIYKSIWHPHILSILEFSRSNGHLTVVTPYYPCGSIEKLRGCLNETEIWHIIRDVASGLKELHSHRILHLDIKPSNILLGSDTSCCYTCHYTISDFGTCCMMAEGQQQVAQDPATRKSLCYASPEFCSRGVAGTYSDVWGLGVTILELICGLPSYSLAEDLLSGKTVYSPLDNMCSKQLADVVKRCLSVNPLERPTVDELLALTDMPFISHTLMCEYDEVVMERFRNIYVKRSDENSLYGVVDQFGNVLVDFVYDELSCFGEYHPFSPGPVRPMQHYVGAFFRQNYEVGFLVIQNDGSICEYIRYSSRLRMMGYLT